MKTGIRFQSGATSSYTAVDQNINNMLFILSPNSSHFTDHLNTIYWGRLNLFCVELPTMILTKSWLTAWKTTMKTFGYVEKYGEHIGGPADCKNWCSRTHSSSGKEHFEHPRSSSHRYRRMSSALLCSGVSSKYIYQRTVNNISTNVIVCIFATLKPAGYKYGISMHRITDDMVRRSSYPEIEWSACCVVIRNWNCAKIPRPASADL